jgi:hypothetical protein
MKYESQIIISTVLGGACVGMYMHFSISLRDIKRLMSFSLSGKLLSLASNL